jgi:O-acetyl-ADP-ribose deacetylase (regulator of RNase III)
VYGYPITQAVGIAEREIKAFLQKNDSLERSASVTGSSKNMKRY